MIATRFNEDDEKVKEFLNKNNIDYIEGDSLRQCYVNTMFQDSIESIPNGTSEGYGRCNDFKERYSPLLDKGLENIESYIDQKIHEANNGIENKDEFYTNIELQLDLMLENPDAYVSISPDAEGNHLHLLEKNSKYTFENNHKVYKNENGKRFFVHEEDIPDTEYNKDLIIMYPSKELE